jgi:adenosine kinase
LSDPFVVARHRDRIAELVFGGAVDVLLGNAEEALGLTGTDSVTAAAATLRRPGSVAVVTLGASGSLVVTPEGEMAIGAHDVAVVEDTTGAGDLFAAGFLFGLTHGLGPEAALKLASFAAAEVIGHLGARPAGRLVDSLPAGLSIS